MTTSTVLVRLTQSVPGLGSAGSLAEVSFGYARNYLLPRQLAAVMTGKRSAQRLVAQRERRITAPLNDHADVRAVAAALDGRTVTVSAPANDEGRLFASVAADMVAGALETDPIFRMDPLKQTGEHQATLDFGHDITATVTVIVRPTPVGRTR